MTGGSVAYYPFPDDGGAALLRTISRLPNSLRLRMTWRPTPDWLLEVTPAMSVALTVNYSPFGVRRLDPTMQSGRLLVPAAAVPAVQEAVARRPDVPAKWSRIEGVEFATARSRRAFEGVIWVNPHSVRGR